MALDTLPQSNVQPIRVGTHKRRPPKPAQPVARREPTFGLQRWVAIGGAVVIAVLLFLSLTHLAEGIQLVTRCAHWQAVSVAVGVDAGLIFAEAALLVACAKAYAAIRRYAWAMVIGTLVVSAALNALAFAHEATGWMFWASIGFGVFIPAAVFVCTKIAAGLVVHR
jgi:hypothetical protein